MSAALERGEGQLECGHPIQCLDLEGKGCGWCADISDMGILQDHLSRTYDHITGGRISKPMTLPESVFAVADDVQNEYWEEWLKEQKQDWESEQVTTLQRRLEQYARHLPGCDTQKPNATPFPIRECTCGLEAALKGNS